MSQFPIRPPRRFADELWHYRRAAMRARDAEHLRRLVGILLDELLAREVMLRDLGQLPAAVYNVDEALMFAKGTSLTPLAGDGGEQIFPPP